MDECSSHRAKRISEIFENQCEKNQEIALEMLKIPDVASCCAGNDIVNLGKAYDKAETYILSTPLLSSIYIDSMNKSSAFEFSEEELFSTSHFAL